MKPFPSHLRVFSYKNFISNCALIIRFTVGCQNLAEWNCVVLFYVYCTYFGLENFSVISYALCRVNHSVIISLIYPSILTLTLHLPLQILTPLNSINLKQYPSIFWMLVLHFLVILTTLFKISLSLTPFPLLIKINITLFYQTQIFSSHNFLKHCHNY